MMMMTKTMHMYWICAHIRNHWPPHCRDVPEVIEWTTVMWFLRISTTTPGG